MFGKILDDDVKKINADKSSESEVLVLLAFGTEPTFGWNLELGTEKVELSTIIVAKILENGVKKCCFQQHDYVASDVNFWAT